MLFQEPAYSCCRDIHEDSFANESGLDARVGKKHDLAYLGLHRAMQFHPDVVVKAY
jgi:hypothetical protein